MKNKQLCVEGSICEIRPRNFYEKIKFANGKVVKIGVVDSGWDRSLIDYRIRKGIGLVNTRDELLLEISSDDNDLNGYGSSCTDIVLRIAPSSNIYPIKYSERRLRLRPIF